LKRYEITIKPLSMFGTPLKGDTLFGQFCWQAAYDNQLLDGGLEKWIACYGERPFAVFSSAWPKAVRDGRSFYALKRPDMPLIRLFPDTSGDKKRLMKERKKNAAKKWLLIPEDLCFSLDGGYLTDQELLPLVASNSCEGASGKRYDRKKQSWKEEFLQPHNTINRMTMTTGEGMFAPYTQPAEVFRPGMELTIFAVIDEEATDVTRLRDGLKRIGDFGFGKDASTGWGRFEVTEVTEKPWSGELRANACYTLGPSVPKRGFFREVFFTPFTRYGRHGDVMARSRNPFKTPVIMAEEGAVFMPTTSDVFSKPYLGCAVRDVSKSLPETVVQGYAPYLPFALEI